MNAHNENLADKRRVLIFTVLALALAAVASALRLLCLFFQGAHPSLQLRENIVDPEHIVLGGSQTALGLRFLEAEAGNARGIFKDPAALIALVKSGVVKIPTALEAMILKV